jgi:peptide chain release factor 2
MRQEPPSKVRIVHVPTGIVVECEGRSTARENRSEAMRMLRSRLWLRHLVDQQRPENAQ